ncbi:inorganic phosphate transporter [Nesterenkonia alkaliphila]|uniref:Inorganic phosphate transporter n=1 Tax=Nesterenkonia alkaliphila TaxID=1463631 RepID=A0A7K1UMC4_9MICC|nr:inorganic phosphate transporter [Nesterenkonia alkaliphila]MVT27635.1 inorganic phosphate transporter [Nesterenkonia alkaliphila]GFZ85718.1 inorganic phosphate transporter [Nesterenkonia alkaliphila]
MELALLVLVVAVMAPNLYVAGLHDVPNSIAIPVRTRALTPRIAVRVAAAFNALGVLLAVPMGLYLYSWFEFPHMEPGLTLAVLLSALLTVLGWNLFTYFQGMPTSTTHALLAALLGGALAAVLVDGAPSDEVWALPWLTPLLTLLISPLVAFGLAYLLVFLAVRIARGEDPHTVNRVSRGLQSVSVGVTSVGTGLQQGQRFSFVLLMALAAGGVSDPEDWMGVAYVVFALLIGAGAWHGGWRIGHVLAHRLVAIDPLRGMVATSAASGLLFAGSLGIALPLSTSLTAASAIMGAGSNQRFATVNWRQFRRIARYWVATPILSGLVAATLTVALSALV